MNGSRSAVGCVPSTPGEFARLYALAEAFVAIEDRIESRADFEARLQRIQAPVEVN